MAASFQLTSLLFLLGMGRVVMKVYVECYGRILLVNNGSVQISYPATELISICDGGNQKSQHTLASQCGKST